MASDGCGEAELGSGGGGAERLVVLGAGKSRGDVGGDVNKAGGNGRSGGTRYAEQSIRILRPTGRNDGAGSTGATARHFQNLNRSKSVVDRTGAA